MLTRYKLLILTIFIVLLAMLPTGCGGKVVHDKDEQSTEMPELTIGIEFYEPFYYIDTDGKIKGIDAEIAEEACRRLGYKPRYKVVKWVEKNEDLKNGKVDAVWACFSMTDREDDYLWAGPYLYDRQIIMVPKDSDKYNMSQLNSCRIGTQRTTQSEALVLQGCGGLLKNVEILSFDTMDEAIAAMREGMVEAVAGHETALMHYTKNEPDKFRIFDKGMKNVYMGVAFDKDGNRILVKALQQVLEDMLQDGTTASIVEKYGLNGKAFTQKGGV